MRTEKEIMADIRLAEEVAANAKRAFAINVFHMANKKRDEFIAELRKLRTQR